MPRLAVVGGGGSLLSDTLDWTYLCPPHKNLVPGDERCGYAVRGDDRPVTDADGESAVTAGGLAGAMLNELEHPQFSTRRFPVGYGTAEAAADRANRAPKGSTSQ